jgi:enoyl-CoA hydratase
MSHYRAKETRKKMNQMMEDLLVETQGSVLTVILNRPKVLNALRAITVKELQIVFDQFTESSQLRVLLLTGMGDRAFSAGGDIKSMRGMTKKEAAEFAHQAHRLIDKIEATPKPVLAAVNGIALGAGFDLALACDLTIASEQARFGEPPPGIGITTPFGGTQRLPRIIGLKNAKYLFFTGEFINATRAYQMGLVNKVVPHDQLIGETRRIADQILTRAPIALAYSKELINMSIKEHVLDGDRTEEELYAKCFETLDQKEGMNAFFEKRKPIFQGK